MVTDKRLWEEVVVNELQGEDLEAREALQWLVEYLGSVAAAGRLLGVDPRMVARNMERIEDLRKLSKRMLEAIRYRMQIIPRRRSDNPLERLVWTVENLDERARVQRRATIELRERIRELEIMQKGPPVRWHATLERLRREYEGQVAENQQMLAETRLVTRAMLEALDAIKAQCEKLGLATLMSIPPVFRTKQGPNDPA